MLRLYNSWREARIVPEDWQPAAPPGHVEKRHVKNNELLAALRELKTGQWRKIYRKGRDGSEVHYFEHESGVVAGVKMKYKG